MLLIYPPNLKLTSLNISQYYKCNPSLLPNDMVGLYVGHLKGVKFMNFLQQKYAYCAID